jgi:NAD(P)-dependent dehydrogenase (short-subunit alcohol dehydrogenase family)
VRTAVGCRWCDRDGARHTQPDGIEALAADHESITAVVADLTHLDAIAALPGEVDILVNKAGVQHVALLVDFPVERFSLILRLMLEAPCRLLQKPAEVAELVTFLAGPAATSISGASITVDRAWSVH